MKRLSKIGTLLKKIYRIYSREIVHVMQEKGFVDLRPSFLEVLISICENEDLSIKEIGELCGLKKQTMTSHLNELEKRNYITRTTNPKDRRQQLVTLTELGVKFKLTLFECMENMEKGYAQKIGELELERLENILSDTLEKIEKSDAQQSLF